MSLVKSASQSAAESCQMIKRKTKKHLLGIEKYSGKLEKVNKLMHEVRCTLHHCNQRSYELTTQNRKIAEENMILKEKIKNIELSQRIKRVEGKQSGNTSQRTQESEWFKSKDSLQDNFEDSADSIMILNDQVEHIKELKTLNIKERSLYMHRKTNSIDRSGELETHMGKSKRKEPVGCWRMQTIESERRRGWTSETNFTQKLIAFALVCSIPGLKFN